MPIWAYLTQNHIEYFNIIKTKSNPDRVYQLKKDYITQALETARIYIKIKTEKIRLQSEKA